MHKRNWLLGFVALFLTFPFNQASAAARGLILGFSAGESVELVSLSTIDRVPAPRSIPGPNWSLKATRGDGSELWAFPIAAPRQFHVDQSSRVAFSVVIPATSVGDHLSMFDFAGVEKWSAIVDTAMLDNAATARAAIERKLVAARLATAKLKSNKGRPALPARNEAVTPLLDANRGLPNSFASARGVEETASPNAMGPMAHSRPKSATAAPLFRVGGVVSINNSEVRVFDATTNGLIASTQSQWWTSRFEFQLPAGRYVFEMDENRQRTDSPFFYRTPTRTAPIQIEGDIEVPLIQQLDQAGVFELTVQVPCTVVSEASPYSNSPIHEFTATVISADGTRVQRVDRIIPVVGIPISGLGYCPVTYGFQLSPGEYAIELAIPGWEAMQFENVQISDGLVVHMDRQLPMSERTLVWTGTVVDETHSPAVYIRVNVIRETDQPYFVTFLVDPDGHFEISYSRGWTLEFEPTWISPRESSIRQRYAVGNGQQPSVVVLKDAAIESDLNDGLLRIYGDGSRDHRYNLLFLAEGYTDAQEAFSDTNGNGQWDAIVWLDMNGDGVFDEHDRYATYGQPDLDNLELPDPSVGNEPFSDINNDQMLNMEEPAKFERNARDFMRSFVGSDFFHEHGQAFNAWLLFEPSQQSGLDITTESGQIAVERSTNYDANLTQPRNLVSIDRQAAINRALVAMPDVDMIVVLVNQNVLTFARGNVSLSQPGLMVWPSGLQYPSVADTGPAHEMGHFVGALCDEYSEFTGMHPLHGNPSSGCPNTSFVSDPMQVPWANWLSAQASVPTRNFDGSLGVYEGAEYYEGGAYRPSYDSLMRGLYPLFNAPSRAALEAAVHERTGEWRDPADASGRCARLPVRAIHRRDPGCE